MQAGRARVGDELGSRGCPAAPSLVTCSACPCPCPCPCRRPCPCPCRRPCPCPCRRRPCPCRRCA
eukprot:scaffold143673_cov208-Phaeocystis_antarctica.AAC.1